MKSELEESYERLLETNKTLGKYIDDFLAKNLDLVKENKELRDREKIAQQSSEGFGKYITEALDDAEAPLVHHIDGEELNARGRIMALRRLIDDSTRIITNKVIQCEKLSKENSKLVDERDAANSEIKRLNVESARWCVRASELELERNKSINHNGSLQIRLDEQSKELDAAIKERDTNILEAAALQVQVAELKSSLEIVDKAYRTIQTTLENSFVKGVKYSLSIGNE
jgi:hypothetical protein